jgi:C4-type Zn-finger protein
MTALASSIADLQAQLRARGAACPTCGVTRHYHGERDNRPTFPAHLRFEILWQCWRCAYAGQEQRLGNVVAQLEQLSETASLRGSEHMALLEAIAKARGEEP